MPPELKIGQRFLYLRGGKFLAEVLRVADSRHADMRVLRDVAYGATPGYVYSSMLLDDVMYWEYLPGQEAPAW